MHSFRSDPPTLRPRAHEDGRAWRGHPDYVVLADPPRSSRSSPVFGESAGAAAGPNRGATSRTSALHDCEMRRRACAAAGIKAFTGRSETSPIGRCEDNNFFFFFFFFLNSFLMGCAGDWNAAPQTNSNRQARVLARVAERRK